MNSKSRKYLVQILLLVFSFSHCSHLYCQKQILSKNRIIDSLTHLITTQNNDSNKVSTFINLSDRLTRIGEYDSAIVTAYRAKLCAENAGYTKGIGNSLAMIGIGHYYKGEFANALKFYTLARKEYEKGGHKKGIASILNSIGGVYSKLGDLPNALDYELKALKMNEEIGNQESAVYANVLNVIGVIYKNQMSYDKSLDYYTRSLHLYQKLQDRDRIPGVLGNIGNVYYMKLDYKKALEFHLQSLQKSEENDDKIGIANAFANIGIIYDKQKLFVKALEYHHRSLQIAREIGDKDGVGGTFSNIAASNISLKKYDVARVWLDSALLFSNATRNKELFISVYRNFAMLDSATGKWNDAYFHYKQYILYRDSLLNDENTEKTVRAEMNFDFERKEQLAKAEQDRKDVIAMEEKQKHRIIIYSVTVGFILILSLALVIFRSLRQNQIKNKLITEQKKQVEEKQKEVMDSIRYAQKIQKAHLPSDKLVLKMMTRIKKG